MICDIFNLHDIRKNCGNEHCQGFQKKIFVKQVDQAREESPHTHTHKAKEGELWNRKSVEEVF